MLSILHLTSETLSLLMNMAGPSACSLELSTSAILNVCRTALTGHSLECANYKQDTPLEEPYVTVTEVLLWIKCCCGWYEKN